MNRDFAIYTVAIAGIWQGAGLVMTLMLAGIRGVDEDIWKATRVDGIPRWRTYISIVLPTVTPSVLTSLALLGAGAVKNYRTRRGAMPSAAWEWLYQFRYSRPRCAISVCRLTHWSGQN